jgi:hypothetical protein
VLPWYSVLYHVGCGTIVHRYAPRYLCTMVLNTTWYSNMYHINVIQLLWNKWLNLHHGTYIPIPWYHSDLRKTVVEQQYITFIDISRFTHNFSSCSKIRHKQNLARRYPYHPDYKHNYASWYPYAQLKYYY